MGFVKSMEEIVKNYQPTAVFYDAEMLTVYFETRPEIVARLLPPPLKPAKEPFGGAFVANYPRTNFGVTYLESALFLQAEYNGAASGIGRGIDERCVQEGMKVVLAGIDEAHLSKTETELSALGGTEP